MYKRENICPKCNLKIHTSRQKHFDSCDGSGPRRRKPKLGYNPWNKGLTKENDKRIKNHAQSLQEKYKNGELIASFKGKHHTKEAKEKLSKRTNFGIVRRSKNEIYFAELCIKHFKKVLINKQMFNGWDADVIIEDIKTAVLWNGKWHYEKIMEKHSLKQVQNRDKIKIKEITNANYMPYIIKDMGRYNKEFVEKEFEKFIKMAS